MNQNNQDPQKPKGLSLKVKTLEKKSAPKVQAMGATPVIGYT